MTCFPVLNHLGGAYGEKILIVEDESKIAKFLELNSHEG